MTSEFDIFAADHVGRLLRLAVVLTGDQGHAEDLTQEALLLAFRKWEQVSSAEHPTAYLRRLLVNLHLTRSRGARPVPVPLDLAGDVVGDRGRPPVLSLEDRDELRAAVAGLPPRQRTVLVLRFFEDLDTGEIAAATGLTESSVRSSLARGLAALRDTFHDTFRDTDQQERPRA